MNDRMHEHDDDPYLVSTIQRLKPTPPRRVEDATEGRIKFLAQARTLKRENLMTQPVSSGPFSRLTLWMEALRSHNARKERYPVLATIVSLIVGFSLLFGGAGVTAYAAQGSLPNDFLYPVKTLTETLRLNLTTDPVKQVDLLLEQTGNRIDEIGAMVDKNQPIPQEIGEQFQYKYSIMNQIMAGLSEQEFEPVMQMVQERVRSQDSALNQIRTTNQNRFNEQDLGQQGLLVRIQAQLHCQLAILQGESTAECDVPYMTQLHTQKNRPADVEEPVDSTDPVQSFAEPPLPASDGNGLDPDAGSGSSAAPDAAGECKGEGCQGSPEKSGECEDGPCPSFPGETKGEGESYDYAPAPAGVCLDPITGTSGTPCKYYYYYSPGPGDGSGTGTTSNQNQNSSGGK
jgi:hypothetical protein